MNTYFHEVVKYHPAGYKDRIYTYDDWTSISDIGKTFRTGILSADDYIKVEDSYVNTILTVMSETDCHYLTIEYVEAYEDEIIKRMKEHKQRYNIPVLDFIPNLKNGKRVSQNKASVLFRLCLRELCYIKFSCKSKKLKIEFGYDYYLYIKCPIGKERLNQIVSENHLYLDPRG